MNTEIRKMRENERMKILLKMPITWILFGWNIIPLVIFTLWFRNIGAWLLGVWRCRSCGRWYWVNEEMYFERKNRHEIWGRCKTCYNIVETSKVIKSVPPIPVDPTSTLNALSVIEPVTNIDPRDPREI